MSIVGSLLKRSYVSGGCIARLYFIMVCSNATVILIMYLLKPILTSALVLHGGGL